MAVGVIQNYWTILTLNSIILFYYDNVKALKEIYSLLCDYNLLLPEHYYTHTHTIFL